MENYAKISDLHSHSNKSILDNITSDKVTEWNNKSTFSGSYNDLTDKPTIPTVTNDLTNTLKSNYDTAYTHSQSAHAPSNAQKNSDITKTEIEEKLIGDITSHTHSQYLTEHQDISHLASETYVDTKISDVVNSAPETLDTLNELAKALGNDENFSTTVATQIGTKVDKVDGMGLSQENYTTEEKTKLSEIQTITTLEIDIIINNAFNK